MFSKSEGFMEKAVLMELLRRRSLKTFEFKIYPLPTENGVGEYTEKWTESSKKQFRNIEVVMKCILFPLAFPVFPVVLISSWP